MIINANNIPCYPCDKELFPAFHEDAQEWRDSTTFYQDFKIAEQYGGLDAVKDTYTRAFASWKHDIKYLCELTVVVNHLGWEHYNHQGDLSAYYFKCYEDLYNIIFSADENGNNNSPYSDADCSMVYRVLD